MTEEHRFVLSQSDIEMLKNRRTIDAKFEAFMVESMEDRKRIRAELADNSRATNEMHTALFAKDDNNDLGITGLVVGMQTVLKHVEVVCNIARFLKWAVVGTGGIAAAAVPFGKIFGWW